MKINALFSTDFNREPTASQTDMHSNAGAASSTIDGQATSLFTTSMQSGTDALAGDATGLFTTAATQG